MKINLFLSFTFAAIVAACSTGCSSSSESPQPIPSNHHLTTGDSFTYHQYQTDLDSVKIDGSDTTITATVVGTNLSIEGRTDVTEIHGTDTVDIAVENDSLFRILQHRVDVSADASIPAIWVPFDARVVSRTILDSSQAAVVNGADATVTTKVEVNYLGKGSVTVNSKAVATIRFAKVITVVVSFPAFGDFTTIVTISYSYAPEIGYVATKSERSYSDTQFSPVPNGITESVLTSYTLK